MEHLNPAERQQVWNQRIEEHAQACEDCQEDRCECETWQAFIGYHNAAVPVDDPLFWPQPDNPTGEEK